MKRILTTTCYVLLFTGAMAFAGCGGGEQTDEMDMDTTGTGMGMEDTTTMGGGEMTAMASLEPTQGNNARGTLTFTQGAGSTVEISGQITGLAPGEHGIHVHENGDCSAPDASSAGGRFNPTGATHGGPDSAQRHIGDLGNITAGQDSTANVQITDRMAMLSGPNAIVGKAVVVHAGADDLMTDPAGNSGNRIACGVVEMQGGGMQGM